MELESEIARSGNPDSSQKHHALEDRPTIVILASGSDFVTGMNRGRTDMATPYLREALRFIGISDVRFVPIGPTTGPADPILAARETAYRRLREIATWF